MNNYDLLKSDIEKNINNLVTDLDLSVTSNNMMKNKFIDWMSNNATGDELIRAGVPSDWIVADKSGGGFYGTRNDIAIVTPPNKKPIFVAVLSKKAEQDAEYDNKLIADATKIIFDLIS